VRLEVDFIESAGIPCDSSRVLASDFSVFWIGLCIATLSPLPEFCNVVSKLFDHVAFPAPRALAGARPDYI